MEPRAYTPASVASIIGTHPNSVRQWCVTYKAYLSPGCNPAPGIGRQLNDVDVARLQLVKGWRDDGVSVSEIGKRLSKLPPNEPTTPYIENAPMPLQPTQEAPGTSIALPVVLTDLSQRIAVLETNSASAQRRQWVMLALVAVGILLGVALGATIVWFVMSSMR